MTTNVLDIRATELPIETGVAREKRRALAEALNEALASTYVLYAKTHAYHWNVAGPLFYSVHKLTDAQYRDLATAVDALAERVRAIGFPAIGGLGSFLDKSLIEDPDVATPSARNMVQTLASDHQEIAQLMREAVKKAEVHSDVYTADLLTSRIGVHEEAAWMLTAMLSE